MESGSCVAQNPQEPKRKEDGRQTTHIRDAEEGGEGKAVSQGGKPRGCGVRCSRGKVWGGKATRVVRLQGESQRSAERAGERRACPGWAQERAWHR